MCVFMYASTFALSDATVAKALCKVHLCETRTQCEVFKNKVLKNIFKYRRN